MSWLGVILTSLAWTGLLALCAEALTRQLMRPHIAQMIWRGAAALMVLPWGVAGLARLWPAAMTDLPLPQVPYFDVIAAAPSAERLAPEMAAQSALPVAEMCLAGLCAGWVVRGLYMLAGQLRLQRLKRAAERTRQVDQSGADVIISPALSTAFAAGVRQRRIYLPAALSSETDRALIIVHERVHIARGDLITRPFERFVADLLWFSPFAWLARRRLDHVRELVCDAETLSQTGAGPAYARALVTAARLAGAPRRTLPVAALIPADRKSLPMRISAIMSPSSARTSKRISGLAALAALVCLPLAVAQGIELSAEPGGDVFTHPVLAKGDVGSGFGMRPDTFDPDTKRWHMGVDIKSQWGEPVMTPGSGTVTFADMKAGYGKLVAVELADGSIVRFAHLSAIKTERGDTVSGGDVIGLVGSSGRSRPAHLHFEVLTTDGLTDEGEPQHKFWDPEMFPITFVAK